MSAVLQLDLVSDRLRHELGGRLPPGPHRLQPSRSGDRRRGLARRRGRRDRPGLPGCAHQRTVYPYALPARVGCCATATKPGDHGDLIALGGCGE